jgi:EpsI family protein
MDLSRPSLEHRQATTVQSAAFVLATLVLTTLIVYHQTVLSLVRLWNSSYTYNYGLILVAACVFFFYRRWVEVGPFMQVRPSLTAGLLILGTSLGWLLGSLVDVLFVQALALLLILGLVVVTVVGYRSAWLFAVPLSLLIFTVPVWDLLIPYLQALTANAAAVLLNLTGIPAFLQGTRISVPAGTFAVVAPCSGINQLLVGMVAAALFAYLKRLGPGTAVWVMAGAVGVSLATNSLRVYATVVLGQLSGMQHYFVTQHWATAWVLFGIGMFFFFRFTGRWTSVAAPAASIADTAATRTVFPAKTVAWSALLSGVGLLVGPVLLHAYQADQVDSGRLRLNVPAYIAGWRADPVVAGGYRPVFLGPDLEYERLYRDAQAHDVYLYVAKYAHQGQGKEAVNAWNRLYDEKVWDAVATRTQSLGDGATVNETKLTSRAGSERLIWQWYYVHGFTVGRGYLAKLLNVWGRLNGDPAITAVVVAIDLKDGYSNTEGAALLARFVADTRPTLERAIADAREP